MSGFNGGTAGGCSWEIRHGRIAAMRLFDSLPRELRDLLNVAPECWCVHCVARTYRQGGVVRTIAILEGEAAKGDGHRTLSSGRGGAQR